MLAALNGGFSRRMKREAEEHQASDARQRSLCLGLRRHPPSEGFSARDERNPGAKLTCLGNGGANGRLRQCRRIRPSAAELHIGKLIAQAGNAALASPAAIAPMNGCVIPAPAPCAIT